jgi:hypothetical protein
MALHEAKIHRPRLLLWAAFPYVYGEAGSARYASEHRVEAIGQVAAAIGLLFVAWQCIRRSFSARTWGIIAAIALAVVLFSRVANYLKKAGERPTGTYAFLQ